MLTGPGDGWFEKHEDECPSSITLPAAEVALIERLKRDVGVKTNVAVVRRALRLLESTMDRDELRRAYREASDATREGLEADLADLDHLAAEGLGE